MNASRPLVLSVLIAVGIGMAPPAQAQTDYEAVVRIIRECRKIGDVLARAACYDNAVEAERLISSVSQEKQRVPAAAADPVQAASSGAPVPAPAAPNFRADRSPRDAPTPQLSADKVSVRVSDTQRVEPGVYVLTMQDGTRWRFVEGAPLSYDPPRAGSNVELRRAALGSVQMRYAGQRPIRVTQLQ
ncbi:hypothetical protein [Altericroceibacterium xinjiangense]|uniref:hypothetical protein n=1 Tax=Altericroceibacterium xinjiangense TaxID=762261 RepID=UPI000F7F00B7|nr:hypothetical protein [Altericroceibacterium xinjiangense]